MSKISLEVARHCCPPELIKQIRCVFVSRHGESSTTTGLLNNIATDELFSPTAFSHSVHNTAAGYFSIYAQNTQPSTSLAAGRDSFPCAFLESMTLLHRNHEAPVLLVLASEPIAEYYHSFVNEDQITFGLALLLNRSGPGDAVKFTFSPMDQLPSGCDTSPVGLSFLRWFLGNEPAITISGERMSWHWERVPHGC